MKRTVSREHYSQAGGAGYLQRGAALDPRGQGVPRLSEQLHRQGTDKIWPPSRYRAIATRQICFWQKILGDIRYLAIRNRLSAIFY
jgi:hypothetical protein